MFLFVWWQIQPSLMNHRWSQWEIKVSSLKLNTEHFTGQNFSIQHCFCNKKKQLIKHHTQFTEHFGLFAKGNISAKSLHKLIKYYFVLISLTQVFNDYTLRCHKTVKNTFVEFYSEILFDSTVMGSFRWQICSSLLPWVTQRKYTNSLNFPSTAQDSIGYCSVLVYFTVMYKGLHV